MNTTHSPAPLALAQRQQYAYERFRDSLSPHQQQITTRAVYYGAGYADGYREAQEQLLSELTRFAGRPTPEEANFTEKHDIRLRRKGIRDAIYHLRELL